MYQDPKLVERLKRQEVESLLKLDQPSLKALSYLLRHKDLWPKYFTWNYNRCNQCAVGLAAELWGHVNTDSVYTAMDDMAILMDMPGYAVTDIFSGGGHWMSKVEYKLKDVTPEMVADQIDIYLSHIG